MKILYKRPKWYERYHSWRYSDLLHWASLIFSVFILLIGFTTSLISAEAASKFTRITQIILPGNLGITLPSFLSFSPIVSNTTEEQVSTALLKGLVMSDMRNESGIDWSITATCSNFVAINAPVMQSGSNDTVNAGGTYDNPEGGTYTLTITKAGQAGVARFVVSGLESSSEITTGTSIRVGTRGIIASFAPANYSIGDSWLIRVDTIPVSGLTLIPQALSYLSGSTEGVQLANKHTFRGKNDPTAIMFASQEHTAGDFSGDLFFSLRIPPFTYANKYTATLVITTD